MTEQELLLIEAMNERLRLLLLATYRLVSDDEALRADIRDNLRDVDLKDANLKTWEHWRRRVEALEAHLEALSRI